MPGVNLQQAANTVGGLITAFGGTGSGGNSPVGGGATGANPLLNGAGQALQSGVQLAGQVAGSASTGGVNWTNALASGGTGAALGAAVGSVVPVVGTAIGGAVGFVAGGVASLAAGLFGGSSSGPPPPRADGSGLSYRPAQFNTSASPAFYPQSLSAPEAVRFQEHANRLGCYIEDVFGAFDKDIKRGNKASDVIKWFTGTKTSDVEHVTWAVEEWFKQYPGLRPSAMGVVPVAVTQAVVPSSAAVLPTAVSQAVIPSSALVTPLTANGPAPLAQGLTAGQVLTGAVNGAVTGATGVLLDTEQGKAVKMQGFKSFINDYLGFIAAGAGVVLVVVTYLFAKAKS